MQIHELEICSRNLQAQFDFYTKVVGFSCKFIAPDAFELITKENKLIFRKSEQSIYYHFAFLIPTGTIHSAINYLESRNIELLPYQGDKIIHFKDGQAIYFYDKDQNIAEFIERPLLDYPHLNHFSIDQVIKLNEIGLPVEEPKVMANALIDNFGILPNNNPPFTDKFCWVGDHDGVIIVTKLGRNWLPTDRPGLMNDFLIHYSDQEQSFRLRFKDNEILRV